MSASHLATVLDQARVRIARHRGASIGEQNTKATLIEPILRALGWDLEDLEEVRREYRRHSSHKPVDYALHLLRTPRLFVEAKGLDENLDDPRWANQIMGYAVVAGVQWVILTNGDEYRIYNAHAPVPVEEKLFRTVRLSDGSGQAEDFELFAKERMQEKWIDALWNAHFVDRQLRTVIEGLFAGIPDPSLLRIIAKRLPALSRVDIRAGLTRARVHLDFPIEPAVAGPPSGAGSAVLRLINGADVAQAPTRGRADRARSGRRPRRSGIRPEVTLAQLIAAQLIQPPLEVSSVIESPRPATGKVPVLATPKVPTAPTDVPTGAKA